MKRLYVLGSILVAASALAACGGGGGSTPAPLPSTQPKTTYAVSIQVQGGAMGHLQDLRRTDTAIMATGTPPPIMMMAPDTTDALAPGNTTASGANLIVVASVSPAPSTAPSVTYVSTDPTVTMSPQPPDPSSANIPGALAIVTKVGDSSSGNAINATVGSPVDTQSSRNLVIFPGHTLYVTNPSDSTATTPSGEYPGYTVTGGTVRGTNVTSGADFYLTSDFQSTAEMNFPHGATAISNNTAFVDVTGSQWQNTFTAYSPAQANTRNADGSLNNIVLFKGSDGTICAYMVISDSYGPGADNWTSGPVRCGI